VDERAVRAPEVLDVPGPAPERQDRVLGGDELLLHHGRGVDVAGAGPDLGERERRALLRFAARRAHDHEPPELRPRLAGGGAKVTDERPGDSEEEDVEQSEEQQTDDPDRQEERVHQCATWPSGIPVVLGAGPAAAGRRSWPACGAASTASMISVVSPMRTWSPSPRAMESTRGSLTQEPFVLRS